MLAIYLFSLLVGGVLLGVSLLGVDHGDVDDAVGTGHGDNAAQFFSLRTLTYFLFVFGGAGVSLSLLTRTGWLPTLLLAVLAGVGVGAIVTGTFRYLSRTESGGDHSDESFVGLSGRVVLPIEEGRLGKVMVQRGDRTYELLAKPLDGSSGDTTSWKSVVVVEMSRGTALVAPLDEPTLQLDR